MGCREESTVNPRVGVGTAAGSVDSAAFAARVSVASPVFGLPPTAIIATKKRAMPEAVQGRNPQRPL
jgi:hypothetical protein